MVNDPELPEVRRGHSNTRDALFVFGGSLALGAAALVCSVSGKMQEAGQWVGDRLAWVGEHLDTAENSIQSTFHNPNGGEIALIVGTAVIGIAWGTVAQLRSIYKQDHAAPTLVDEVQQTEQPLQDPAAPTA